MQMPHMDGVAATEHIRSHFSKEIQPLIIAMTAHALKGDREKYIAVGMDNYISKPVRVHELTDVLNECYPLKEGEKSQLNRIS